MAAVLREVCSDLAPGGRLRVAINLSNFLLTKTDAASGRHGGVAVDLGMELGRRLQVPVDVVPFSTPGELADAAGTGAWDVGFLAAEPQRADTIDFTAAYVEIEATYLVPGDSPIQAVGDVDSAGVRIGVMARSAYELFLARNLKHATLVREDSMEQAFTRYVQDGLDALAGLRPGLLSDQKRQPGSRILQGNFTSVKQAAGTPKGRVAGAAYLREFIEDVKKSGLVRRVVESNGIQGLTVAPPAA